MRVKSGVVLSKWQLAGVENFQRLAAARIAEGVADAAENSRRVSHGSRSTALAQGSTYPPSCFTDVTGFKRSCDKIPL